MQIEVLKSKIHRVTVTGAELGYIGSITIDKSLMDAANIIAGEKVQVVNVNNGERLETYVIEGGVNSGEITLNGPAARKVQKGDVVIIISYASRRLIPGKRSYFSYKLELCSLVSAIEHLCFYLIGRKFLVRTDNKALLWLLSTTNKNVPFMLFRWQQILQG